MQGGMNSKELNNGYQGRWEVWIGKELGGELYYFTSPVIF